MNLGTLSVIAWGVMAVLMAGLWLAQYRTHNAGTVDVAWAFGTGVVGIWFSLGAAGGVEERQWLLATLVAAWGARLGYHLFRRVAGESEDGRYRYMREHLGEKVQPFMFGFFQVQAGWALLFALPMWAAATNPSPALGWHDYAGLAVWLFAIGGESVADRQLARFRDNPDNKGQVCRDGMWAWSRHPNYFFEWLHWLAYVLIGLGSPYWWVTLAALPVMYVFLVYLTGIPWTEQQSVRSRGEAYQQYQREVPAFFPRPPKSDHG